MPSGVYNHKKSRPYFKHSKKTKEKIKKSLLGHPVSEETIEKMSGKNSPRWKGGGYNYKHYRIIKEKGRATNYICEICEKKQAKHWSNINHKYKKNPNDYRALCCSCHKNWDNKLRNGLKN